MENVFEELAHAGCKGNGAEVLDGWGFARLRYKCNIGMFPVRWKGVVFPMVVE